MLHVAAQAQLVSGDASLLAMSESMRWATPTLFVISGFLAGSAPARGFFAALGRRAVRLLLPYAFWVAVYIAVASLVDRAPFPHLFDVVFLGGSQYSTHLWFLTTLLICVPVGLLLTNKYAALGAALLGFGLLTIRYLTGWATPLDWPISLYYPFLNWLELYLIGVVLARWLGPAQLKSAPARWAAAPAFVLAVAMSAAVYWTVGGTSLLGYLALVAAAALLALAARSMGSLPRQVQGLCTTALGVYIVHPLFMAAFGRVVPVARLTPGMWVVSATIVVTVASILATLALGRIPLLKRVVQ